MNYEDFPALEKIHTLVGKAVLGRDPSAVRSALYVLQEDFISLFKNQNISAIKDYENIPSRRLSGIEAIVTYREGIGNFEAGWVGLDLSITGYQRALYKSVVNYLMNLGKVTQDKRNDAIRVKVGEKDEYLIDAPAHKHTVFVKACDL